MKAARKISERETDKVNRICIHKIRSLLKLILQDREMQGLRSDRANNSGVDRDVQPIRST